MQKSFFSLALLRTLVEELHATFEFGVKIRFFAAKKSAIYYGAIKLFLHNDEYIFFV